MPQQTLPPIPNQPVSNTHEWREWFFKLWESLGGTQGQIYFNDLNFTGSNITSIQTRAHNTLQGLQGGNLAGTEYYHLDSNTYNKIANTTYGSFSNTVDQLTTDNTPTVVALNTTDTANNMTLATNQISVDTIGIYNLQFSLQFVNTHSQAHNAWVWLRKNGTDIAGTGSKYDVPSTHGSSDGYLIAVCNFLVEVTTPGDYFEVVFAVEQANIISPAQLCVYIEAYVASTSPFTMPAIPSSVVTVTPVA